MDDLSNFLLLAKSTKGAACAALVKQALDHPNIYVFGELLDMTNVAEVTRTSNNKSRIPITLTVRCCTRMLALQLAGTPASAVLDLLKLFAYGTWSDYKTSATL